MSSGSANRRRRLHGTQKLVFRPRAAMPHPHAPAVRLRASQAAPRGAHEPKLGAEEAVVPPASEPEPEPRRPRRRPERKPRVELRVVRLVGVRGGMRAEGTTMRAALRVRVGVPAAIVERRADVAHLPDEAAAGPAGLVPRGVGFPALAPAEEG
ncbi:hypothetical protein B0H16DRAFT_1540476 [Mycena metata]|uniref:Uncharacterized protein n=1 Tax=Mycena metata TaxID=1033252 RepID=A0AAD7NC01_9AGAR|nr:hypothetical protein B0H16DRAFT_1540476 [Mycena metata]